MEETPSADKSINFSKFTSNDEKIAKVKEEIVVQNLMSPCLAAFMIIFSLFFIPFIFPIILIWFNTPYKNILVFDGVNKVLIKSFRGICGCCICTCCCLGGKIKRYYLSQIQKVKIYRTSIPDPNVGFNKIYFINCDIYSIDNQMESLFNNIPFNQDKYDELVSFLKKYLNTEVIPFEVDINTYDVNNNALYP